jgi:protein ImuB
LGTARGSEPEPRFLVHDPQADLTALRKLALWCQRFTPVAGLEGNDNLLLDLSGCTHLFGGEQSFTKQLHHRWRKWGFGFKTAIADTVGAAWAVAHFGEEHSAIVPSHQQELVLQPLPVASLRMPSAVTESLLEFGIRSVKQLRELPRESLRPRFGPEVTQRLDQALGAMEEHIVPEQAPEPIRVSREFEDALSDRRSLEFLLDQMIEEITEKLSQQQRGVQRLEVTFLDGRKQNTKLVVGTLRPTQNASHLRELVRARWDQISNPTEISAIQMEAVAVSTLATHQERLFETGENPGGQREFARLVDRLSNRLGIERVVRPKYVPDAQPEFACRWEPVLETGSGIPSPPSAEPHRRSGHPAYRPLLLLAEPRPIEVVSVIPDGPPICCLWENHSYTVTRYWGPERIETGWWRERHVCRDYYRIETDSGQRFWIFRRREQEDWFLHGEFE